MISIRAAVSMFLIAGALCPLWTSARTGAALASNGVASEQAAEHRPHAGMLRFPDVSDRSIAFVYANDIWVVPRDGGVATPLASPAGQELFPRFSPDGQAIAFVGNYDGNRDLYVIDTDGGTPARVTHHPDMEILCDWTPDGGLLFFSSGQAGLPRQSQLFTVGRSGGLPAKLPVPYGANGAISADGQWLAYTPHTRDHRTWKRYRGGMATDIWLFNLQTHEAKKITDWEGTDSLPMWHGTTLYYVSDAGPEHRLNIWSYDTVSGQRKQITRIAEFDIKWPSIGPGPDGKGEIVFQSGASLYLLDLPTGDARAVEVQVPGDQAEVRPLYVDARKTIGEWNISSTGKRAVIEARGDIWTVPASKGSARNLTRSSGAAERDPAWSPDGRWIAYFSDVTGEYELYLAQSDGKGEVRQLTRDGKIFRYAPTWSPDSKYIAFSDKTGAKHLHAVANGTTRVIDTDPQAELTRLSWSPDSRWLAYTKTGENRLTAIWIYDVEQSKTQQVTSGMFNDTWPTFDRDGKYLFFATQRKFDSPLYEDLGTTFVYAETELLAVVPLRDEVGSPWAPESDEETWGDDKKKAEDAKDDDSTEKAEKEDDSKEHGEKNDDDKDEDDDKKKEIEPVVIELDGFEARAIALPVDKGTFGNLAVNDKGELIYVRRVPRGSERKSAIRLFALPKKGENTKKDNAKKENGKDKEEEKTVLAEVENFVMSADGKKLLVRQDETMAIVDAAPDQKLDAPLVLSGMKIVVDRRAEWRQLFREAWRIERDFFYDPTMHGLDWQAIHKHYQAMIEDCTSREDVDFVIGEMIAELNVGHAYVRGGGDLEEGPEVSVGMLGADFELDSGAYRINRIHQGAAWDLDARGPLSQPGVDVTEGDYLLAVQGIPVDVAKDPWAAFQGLAGQTVTLTVSGKPQRDDEARDVVVKLLDSDADLRFRSWIEQNRAYVDEKTDGRVGYIYVPDTGRNGQNELFRQFYGQVEKQALIIDERWNGGGQIPSRFIELLNRPTTNFWAVRDGVDSRWPPDSHQGPKCMLINGLAGSGGDCFPYYFRQAKLGKLIGMRTWGGLVGISGNPRLIDGGFVTAPTFAFYETDGTWGVEGHGVDPDIEVIDDPSLMVDGGDPQLDRAIAHMLEEIGARPYTRPARPNYPVRTGMGIREEDR